LIGVTQKSVLADGFFAPIAERLYAGSGTPGFIDAWAGTLAFAGQIYNDFAGYSTCAIGTALCLGFELPENFRYPYAAIGFSDFWRRWHISLSTWLRDYLYISLGGNRRGAGRTNVNLMITMLLGGLWHGASWTFVVWGGLHGAYLVLEKGVKRLLGDSPFWRSVPARLVGAALTFVLVCVTWVFFRADSFAKAFEVVRAMVGLGAHGRHMVRGEDVVIAFGLTTLMLAYQWRMRGHVLSELARKTPWPYRAVAMAAMLVGIVNMSGDDRAFIYFQF
nr:MBOAT family O-acyltransferase [Polyangiaceae bacterium]